jgi:FixJ family two-component response regulator
MQKPDFIIAFILLSILFIPIAIGLASSQVGSDESAMLNQVFLTAYIDDSGRALINGYVDDPKALDFLNSSEYTYEDSSKQLYAITSALTSKSRDNWTLSFESKGKYDEYQIMLYLPANAKLRRVECSSGLDYLVYAANESFIAEIQGYDITDPAINIEYRLPLAEVPKVEAETTASTDEGQLYMALAIFILLVVGSGILVFLLRSRSVSMKHAEQAKSYVNPGVSKISSPSQSNLSVSAEKNIDTDHLTVPLKEKEDTEGCSRISETSEAYTPDKKHEPGIEMTGEIAAVMNTLTDKEQSVLKALLQRGGTMTQTEIGYETDISKSSLSGILTSLEKRKIITKKERGRTNVIEISNRFSNIQERF